MALSGDFPVELLLKVLNLATQLDDPMALECPLINWQSTTDILFRRARAQRRESLVARASLALVCKQWNGIATPWLYEHITIDSDAKLAVLVRAFETATPRMMQLTTLAKRVDIELPRGISDASYQRLVALLPFFDNVVTLVMALHPPKYMELLLYAVPPSLKHLLWSSDTPDGATNMSAPAMSLSYFLESHPRLETFSHPFYFDIGEMTSVYQSKYQQPHPSLRTWVVRNLHHFWNFGDAMQVGELCGNIVGRTMTFRYKSDFIGMASFLTGIDAFASPPISPIPRTEIITEISLCVELLGARWPPKVLSDDLHIVEALCPNLREFNLTLIAETEDVFTSPLEPITAGISPVPQVTAVSIQRLSSGSEISDPVGTLHHAIRVPWRTVFPNIQAIRIREDIDLGAVVKHPTMAFAKGAGWTISIEDRFGELLL